MADQKELDKADLEDIMDAVLQVAQLVLRHRYVREKLNETQRKERTAYWRVFFQVVLSNPFGRVMPGEKEWHGFKEELARVRKDKQQSRDFEERISRYDEWRKYYGDKHILYAVAQFWNADDLRVPAFVVNEELANVEKVDAGQSPVQGERVTRLAITSERWDEYWQLMNEINTLESDSKSDKYGLAPVSIGNFIIKRSRELNDTCPIFRLHVGPDSKFQEFKNNILPNLERGGFNVLSADDKHLSKKLAELWQAWGEQEDYFYHLEIPAYVASELLHAIHLRPRLSREGILANCPEKDITLLEMLEPLGRTEQANLVAALAEGDDEGDPVWDAWRAPVLRGYLEYVRSFFLWNYYPQGGDHGEYDSPTPYQLRLTLLNNLLVARSLIAADEGGDEEQYHYQYFLPTWHKSTSYLALVTRGCLTEKDLNCFRKFAERLFGLAWAHDSARKLEEDKARIIAQTERAARAAILARNFSHTVGSHVLNSPGFAMALTRGRRGEELGREADEFLKRIRNVYNGEKATPALEFSRALRRRVDEGQRLLGTAREVLDAGLFKTTTFHRFLQGRFDFIARAIEDRPHAPEPVFFVEDLMEGFVSQTVFLDHLVKDLGWQLDSLRFRLYLPREKGPSEAQFDSEWKNAEGPTSHRLVWKPAEGVTGTVNDYAALVGSPGGATGAHAFYAVLENLIRNSFKYGGARRPRGDGGGTTYTLSLRLTRSPDGQGWRLQLWDNFSIAGDPGREESTFSRINRFLSQHIVDDETGELRPEGLGIKEVALCARSLFLPRPVRSGEPHREPLRLIGPSELKKVCPAARLADKSYKEQPLVYELSLEEPVLLAVYDERAEESASVGWVRRYASLQALARSGAHIGILPGDLPEGRMAEIFGEIAEIHPTLPYRLLVVCANSEQKAGLEALLRRSGVPPRRVHCFFEKTERSVAEGTPLYHYIKGAETATNSEEVQEQDWVCRAYEAWLSVWKGTPEGGKWHLFVGFERSPSVVADTWGKLLTRYQARPDESGARRTLFSSGIVSIVVKSKVGDESEIWLSDPTDQEIIEAAGAADPESEQKYWRNENALPYSKKRAFVFDNHGSCFTSTHFAEKAINYRWRPRFYQQTSGGKTFELFQRLSNIPSNPFGFSFFVYSLIESCLTVVAVADERVAADLLFTSASSRGAGPSDFKRRLAEHQKAGVFPLFQLRSGQGKGAKVAHYSLQHSQALREVLGYKKNEYGGEGIWLRSESSPRCMLRVVVPNDIQGFREEAAWNGWPDEAPPAGFVGVEEAPPIDFLLVHEGAIDMFRTNNRIEWDSDVTTMTLFDIAPGVIRTSGRGRHSRNLGESVPFLEASVLTAALITSKNKYELSRALLGSIAEKSGAAETDSQV